MNRGTWLKARREELKYASKGTASDYSLRGVAEFAGVSAAGLSNLERTDAMPTLDLALKLAEYYGKSIEWVLTGKDTRTDKGIPVVGNVTNGPNAEFMEHGLRFPDEFQFVDMPTSSRRQCYALRINDEASSAAYRTGEFAIFDPNMAHILGEDHLVKFANGDTVAELLLLISERDGQYVFNSVRDGHRRIVKDIKDVVFMLPVLAVAKAFAIRK